MTNQSKTLVIEVDSDLESLVPDFLENRKKDGPLIVSLLESGSFGEIRSIGHRMKGAGGSFGFDEISVIGEKIELAALAGDAETISGAVQQLEQYLERVVAVYV
jgi:HPt (histidine-containing phosphotransfer) domain-containing protein